MSRSVATLAGTILLILLVPKSILAQKSDAVSTRAEDLASQRFEIGLTGSFAFAGTVGSAFHGDNSAKLFAGASGSYSLKSWLALGAELAVLDAFQNNSHDCYGCVQSGVLTMGLGELRLPLGSEHARLFGRFAVGPAFTVGTDEQGSVRAAARASFGLDFRWWHAYARPFVFFGLMTRVDPQVGPGLELGASF
jgi:hypothetical protein